MMITRNLYERNANIPFVKLKGPFCSKEIDTFKNYFESCPGEKIEAETGGAGIGNKYDNLRKNRVKWIGNNNNPIEHEIFCRLLDYTNCINRDFFGFDLTGFNVLQWTCYEEQGDHYEWHHDAHIEAQPEGHRKLSFSLIFSDKSEYSGGNLQFKIGNQLEDFSLDKGDCMVFPSWQTHRVTPVLEGKRYSLVWWVLGPKFR